MFNIHSNHLSQLPLTIACQPLYNAFQIKMAAKCPQPYDAHHFQQKGYGCKLRHSLYEWPSVDKAKTLLLGDSIVKYVRHVPKTDTVSIQGARVRSLMTYVWAQMMSP
jgi:hypothetical protein